LQNFKAAGELTSKYKNKSLSENSNYDFVLDASSKMRLRISTAQAFDNAAGQVKNGAPPLGFSFRKI
jgi:hypothetical protein